MDKHVACMAATGTPTSLKGLGITHPAALDLAEKACALLRLLNTSSPAGIAALPGCGVLVAASDVVIMLPSLMAETERKPKRAR
jgi:hypothetical protein